MLVLYVIESNFAYKGVLLLHNRKTVDVWRTVLEETEKVNKMRLEAAESCLEKISNECKEMKTNRANCVKMVCSWDMFVILFT